MIFPKPEKEISKPPKVQKEFTSEERIGRLVDYVQEMLKKNYPMKVIRRAILNSRWTRSEMEKAIHLALIPPEKEAELYDYVKMVLGNGYKKPRLRIKLIDSGWDREIVDHIIKIVEEDIVEELE